jgi:type IV pilus assembly protein PilA
MITFHINQVFIQTIRAQQRIKILLRLSQQIYFLIKNSENMFKNKKNKSNKGFTLIELLVVVAIVSLLSSIVFATLTTARTKGRNTSRIAAAQSLRNAFNLSLTSSGFPVTGTVATPVYVCVSVSCYEAWAPPVTSTDATLIATINAFYTPSLVGGQKPTDPTGGTRGRGGYMYVNPMSASVGPVILYAMEGGPCGPGTGTPGATFTACFLYLDR